VTKKIESYGKEEKEWFRLLILQRYIDYKYSIVEQAVMFFSTALSALLHLFICNSIFNAF
jgi:hypothetical protein